jgi:mevalonate kinase
MLKECTVNVPGKIIITGEHSVLQGCPAIAAACSRYITNHLIKNDTGKIEFKDKEPLPPVAYKLLNQAVEEFKRYFTLDSGVTMEFSSTLPIGSGMGSSAAVAASVFAGLCVMTENRIAPEAMLESIKRCENIIHGTSSGLDPAAVIYGGMVKKADGVITPRPLSTPLHFYIVNTGKPECSTGEAVAEAKKHFTPSLITQFTAVAERIEQHLEAGDLTELIVDVQENEKLLEAIGVVPEQVQGFARKAEALGMGFKISGAGAVCGDKGGIGLLFMKEENQAKAQELCQSCGYTIDPVQFHIGGLPCLA